MPEYILQYPLAVSIEADSEADAREKLAGDREQLNDALHATHLEPEDFDLIEDRATDD